MGNQLSKNRRRCPHHDLDVDSVRIPNESECHEPAIPKQLKSSPAEFNEQNILEEKKHIWESKKTSGHSNCQTDPKELKTSPPSSHQPPPNLGACNKFYQKENIHTGKSYSDAANSVKEKTSMNINGISINILGENNVINCHFTDHPIDDRCINHFIDYHRQSQPRGMSEPLRVLKVKKGVVSPQTIFEVAENVGADWRKLGIHLNFSINELDTLYHDHHFEGAVEICYRLLTSWRERLASEATYLVLGNALKKIGRHDVVKKLITMSDD